MRRLCHPARGLRAEAERVKKQDSALLGGARTLGWPRKTSSPWLYLVIPVAVAIAASVGLAGTPWLYAIWAATFVVVVGVAAWNKRRAFERLALEDRASPPRVDDERR